MSELFASLFVPPAVREAASDAAWLRAMLDAEAALAGAQAEVGVIPEDAAAAIAAVCGDLRLDPSELGAAARASGNPVVPLVGALRAAVPGEAAAWVHHGATSQDVLDTAAMLVARRALEPVLAELDGVVASCARLAREHRRTLMAGRTLLQQAVPITFGLKAAGWLVGVADARDRLAAARLAAQLGGAAGTLAAFGERGPAVLAAFARRVGLAEPALPWHGARGRVASLGADLAIAAGAAEKIALDITLLAQTEVAEVAEAAPGGSSAMPHKRNPAAAVRARAAARSVRAAAGVLLEAMAGEHERAAGAWHSEWTALSAALAGTGGAAAAVGESLAGLTVDTERMRANIDPSTLAERLAHLTGDPAAVAAACERAGTESRPLADVLRDDPAIALDEATIAGALDPTGYLGAADTFIGRALARAGDTNAPESAATNMPERR